MVAFLTPLLLHGRKTFAFTWQILVPWKQELKRLQVNRELSAEPKPFFKIQSYNFDQTNISMWFGDWGNGSVVKHTWCFCRGPGFDSRHPYGSSQVFVTNFRGSDPFFWSTQALHAGGTHIYMWEGTHTHKINTNIYFKVILMGI